MLWLIFACVLYTGQCSSSVIHTSSVMYNSTCSITVSPVKQFLVVWICVRSVTVCGVCSNHSVCNLMKTRLFVLFHAPFNYH